MSAQHTPVHGPVTDEENERFSQDVSNFMGADPAATKYALEAFLRRRAQAHQPAQPADVPMLTHDEILSAFCIQPNEMQYVRVFFAGAKWAEKTVRQKAGLP